MKTNFNIRSKKYLVFNIADFKYFLMILAILIANHTHAQSWEYVGGAGFSANGASYCYITIDRTGTPYIDCGEQTMKYNGSTWDVIGGGTGPYASLAIDTGGTPYLIYSDATVYDEATVVKYNGSTWETVGNPDFSYNSCYYNAIAFDKNGTPYVVFADTPPGVPDFGATVMKYNDTMWVPVGNPDVSAGTTEFNDIVIDGNGTPYVVYEDFADSNKATVMKFVDTAWVSVGIQGFSAGAANYTFMALDTGGTPYVVYEDGGNDNKATVMKYDGTAWVNVGSPGFTAGTALYTSIAIDGNGTPFVAYEDGVSGPASVMAFNGSNWVYVGNEGFSGGTAAYTSMAIDNTGKIYVVFSDSNYSGKASVMTPGAWLGTKNIENQVAALSVYPNPNNGTFTLNISSPEKEDVPVTITNMLGERVKEMTVTTNKPVSVQIEVPKGVYFVGAMTKGGSVNEQVVVE